MTIMQAVFNIH